MRNRTVYLIVTGLVIALILLLIDDCNKRTQKTYVQEYEALQDTLTKTRDKSGKQTAQIALLQTTTRRQLLKLHSSDSTVRKLQSLVKEYKGKLISATVLTNTTLIEASNQTTVIHNDTIHTDSAIYIYPTYTTKWKERWSEGRIIANRDSIEHHILVKNDFEITQGYKRDKWWKAKEAVVTVRNLNPYTDTEQLRSFNLKQKQRRLGLAIQAGYGIYVPTSKAGIFIGAGISYRILNIGL